MRYRRQDENGDYTMGNGKFDFLVDLDAFVQAVYTKLKLFRGEWWEDLSQGVPFYEQIAGAIIRNDEDKNLITQIYLDIVGQVDGFQEVVSYTDNFDYENRKYSLVANVDTVWGTTKIEV